MIPDPKEAAMALRGLITSILIAVIWFFSGVGLTAQALTQIELTDLGYHPVSGRICRRHGHPRFHSAG